jgi:hypothetical protein
MERLPKSVDYSTPLATMPDSTVNYCVACTPSNGSSFGAGNTIIVDLNNVPGFLDPASLSIRYKYTATTASNTVTGVYSGTTSIVGAVGYSAFLRLDVLANSSVVESINNYNSLATMLSNISMGVSEKLGVEYSMGYAGGEGDADMSNQNDTDGIILATGSTATNISYAGVTVNNYISVPLIGCSLSNAEKLVPLDYVNWRLQFTIDSVANICSNLAANNIPLSSFTITNFEVVYNQIQFPSPVHQQIKMQNPKIRIKTKSFGVGAQPISAGSNGTINLYYNLRYASIRSLFLSCGPSATTFASKLMESVDPTTGNGSIQFSVGGVVMPQQVLSTLNNKAGILNELRRAMGSIYSRNTSMAIGASEYLVTPASGSSVSIPGKFYVGINCQKLTEDQDYMFTGVSSANSQINVIINTATSVAAGNPLTALLIANYDAIYEIDTLTRQMNYIQ